MTDITVATHRSTATTAFSSRRGSASLAAGTLLVMATLAALLLAMQSGQSARATAPVQEQVQQHRVIDQATEPIYFPGRPS